MWAFLISLFLSPWPEQMFLLLMPSKYIKSSSVFNAELNQLSCSEMYCVPSFDLLYLLFAFSSFKKQEAMTSLCYGLLLSWKYLSLFFLLPLLNLICGVRCNLRYLALFPSCRANYLCDPHILLIALWNVCRGSYPSHHTVTGSVTSLVFLEKWVPCSYY